MSSLRSPVKDKKLAARCGSLYNDCSLGPEDVSGVFRCFWDALRLLIRKLDTGNDPRSRSLHLSKVRIFAGSTKPS